MKLANYFIAGILLITSALSYGANKETKDVKVSMLSVWTENGDILVQTSPKHDIVGLSCTNDYWLVLDKEALGYEATLAMLLSAYTTQSEINITAEDNGGSDFCKVNRVVNLPN